METENKKTSWYHALTTGIETIGEQLELQGEERLALREFLMKMAKEQYMAGNKAGIKWLRMQMNKGPQAAG